MKIKYAIQIALCLLLFYSSNAVADEGKDESGKGGDRKEYKGEYKERMEYKGRHKEEYKEDGTSHDYFHEHGYDRLDIPKGHYPPPGECRVWYPERPAGQQPPPGKCGELAGRVPPGAWLIKHPQDDLDHVLVNVYDEHRPGRIHVVGQFEIGTGSFVRIVINK